MANDLTIDSFDDLKTALNKALHDGGTPPETANYLMERFDVLCVDFDNVFLAISADDIKEYYPNLSIDEAREVRDNANENLWYSGGFDDLNDIAWGQIKAEVKCIRTDRDDSTHAENGIDELAETYGSLDAHCIDDIGETKVNEPDAGDIPR